jgi:transcriptional regulator with XRE-family HTH domain
MRITNVYRKDHRTHEQRTLENEARKMFQDWKPGPEELLASGRWKGPVIVEGQQQFWKAIRQVRSYREAQGLTLKDISERCGIDVATLSKLENGKQPNPTLFTMLLYVGAVGQRLHFVVQRRPPVAMEIREVRDVRTDSNGAPQRRPARSKAKRKG